MKKYNQLISMCLVLLMILSAQIRPSAAQDNARSNPIDRVATASDPVSFSVSVPAGALSLEDAQTEAGDFTQVTLPGWFKTSVAGEPELPFTTRPLGVPFEAEIEVVATPGSYQKIPLVHPVLPVMHEVVDWGKPEPSNEPWEQPTMNRFIQADPAVYASSTPYPGKLAEIVNDGILRQQRIISVAVYPVQFDPASNELIIYEDIYVEVNFKGGQLAVQGITKAESPEYEAFFEQNLLNYEQAKAWRMDVPAEQIPVVQEGSIGSAPWTPPSPGWRIYVREDGFYKLTYSELQAAGVPVTTLDEDTLQMFHLGEEIDILINPGKSIVFYGQSIDSKYTDKNVYWLTYGNANGLRMADRRVGIPTTAPVPETFIQSIHFEEDINYRSRVIGSDDYDRFFGGLVVRNGTSVTKWSDSFLLEGYHSGSVKLKGTLAGYLDREGTEPDHHAEFIFNGETVGDLSWYDFQLQDFDIDISSDLIISGSNTLEISALPTAYPDDYFLIDWVELQYASTFQAIGNELRFSYNNSGDWEYQIAGFDTDQLMVYDISDPAEVFMPNNVIITGAAPAFTVSLIDSVSEYGEYWVKESSDFLTVLKIEQDTASDLQHTENQAYYLMIAHDNFMTQADVLRGFRDDPLDPDKRAVLVDVQDVYDEFGYGIVDVYAIRDFLAYAYDNWNGTPPTYVLLVGDGHYDPKNNANYGRESYIPPFLANCDPVMVRETAADNRYVDFVGADTLPDMMIGRLSVNTGDEAQAFVEKIIAYESTVLDGDWQRQLLAIADNPDTVNYALLSEYLINDLYPSAPYQADEVYYLWNQPVLAQARADIKAGFNTGKLIVNYIGHGYNGGWADEGLLTTTDIVSLQPQDKLPVILAMTCMEGYFIYPHPVSWGQDAMGEMITRAAGKGAAASWSPTGWGTTNGHEVINRAFFKALFQHGTSILGAAVKESLIDLWSTGSDLDLLDTYMIFGDPAMHIALRFTAVADQFEVDEDTLLVVDSLIGVLANDINPDNETLTAVLVDDVDHGTLSLAADGSFTYQPDENFYGNDGFRYQASNGTEGSNSVVVEITVLPINDPPAAHDQNLATPMETPLDITLTADDDGSGISMISMQGESFALDEGLHNSGLTFNILTQPTQGILDGEAGSAFRRYTPGEGYAGPDSFTFEACDYQYCSEPATVSITVTSGIPVAFGQSVETDEDITLDITLTGVAHEGTLTFQVETPPTNGILSGTAPDLTYTPDLNFNGSDSFTFSVTDDSATSAAATIDITIKPVNDAPLAEDQAVSVNQGESTAITLTASDVEGDSLTYQVTTQPKNGKLSGVAPNLVYTPDANFNGKDSFKFRAFDGALYSDSATVTITIIPFNAIYLPLIHR